MKFINLKENKEYLKEYISLCSKEWGSAKTKDELNNYINKKMTLNSIYELNVAIN